MGKEDVILVVAGWLEDEPVIGKLFCLNGRGRENYSFEFSDDWLNNNYNLFLDPDLFNGRGRQFILGDKKIFGFLSDCAPDRWGRTLMKRKEVILARTEERAVKELNELDFILGVNDESRVGGLRFKKENGEEYLSVNDSFNVPPFESLRKLQYASLEFENNENPDETKWLKMLLEPGSSLGGARPKATIKDTDGSLWVAKFPSKNDDYDVGAWEITANKLAELCGLNTTVARSLKFSNAGTTFLSKRFDRKVVDKDLKRIHYASAMTVLGKSDGAGCSDGTSYLDIAEFIKNYSVQPEKDLEELWNRIYFNVAISNTDDHLRNHGFLLSEDGWRLAPLFDVNPNIYGNHLVLNIDEFDNSKSVKLVMDCAGYYGLSATHAKANGERISQVVNDNWKRVATRYEIGRSEIVLMEDAFRQ